VADNIYRYKHMKDLLGKALLDYYSDNYTEDLITWTNISEEDKLPLNYLFRDFKTMPQLEQKALKLAKGKILDIGCGAGSHSLYLQQKNMDVTALDHSKGAISVCKKRGILKTKNASILEFAEITSEKYDTILLLMNGTGIFESLSETSNYLKALKKLLSNTGQILIDSSDIKYMYEDDDGGYWLDINANYYGELDYFLRYKGEDELPMKWLYLDFNSLYTACLSTGLKCEMLAEGDHYDYLAKISL